MGRIIKTILLTLAVVVLLVAGVTVNFLHHGGAFKTLKPHFGGSCEALATGGPSGEDIQIDHDTGIAYISALDRRALIRGEDVRGTVLQLDLNVGKPRLTPAVRGAPEDFRPHGLSLFVDDAGRRSLLVISHPPAGHHTVERFEQHSEGIFEHRETLANALLFDPNDLVAIGPRQFYVVNDSGAHSAFQRVTEMLFARALATLVYYDGSVFRVTMEGLAAPAGVNVIRDERRLLVGETQGQRVRVLDYSSPGSPVELGVIDLGSGVDNIDTAADNAVWVAAHANTLSLVQHFANASKAAPSQIFRIELAGDSPRVQEVYLNGGEEISAGSVGATYNNRLLIGSITEPKILVCELPSA